MARKILTCPPPCGARFDVSKYDAGAKVRCGKCGQVLAVPAGDPPVAPPVAPVVAPAVAPVVAPAPRTGARGGAATPARPVAGAPAPATRTGVSGPVVHPTVQPVVQPAAQPGGRPTGPAAPPPAAEPAALGAVAPASDDPLVGRVIHGQYRLVRKLGEGGYGAVYEAKDVHLERRVAIKIMLQARAQSREYVAKFLREARTAAQLTHPNVVAVHGVGFDRDSGVHFLAMEYVEGRTFHDILQERGPMPADEACGLIVQSCRGLQAAHERNIIHRDIKPGNLMLTPGGAVKITDFGLAKVYDEAAAQSTVIGTPYFMPPEQFEGKAKDGRTDIYALGVTFYYMLTLQRPHTGSGPAQILLSVMTKEPASILDHRPDLPEGLWPIVRRMIHRDVERRYATCAEVITDLERLLGGGVEEVEQVYCPSCGVPNAVDAEKCAGCSESLQEKCPVCGATDAAGTKFCGDCGSNIPLERAVLALVDEAQGFLQTGRLLRAKEKLLQAQERSPQNLRIAQLLRDLEIRREQRDAHRDAVRELLAHGRPHEALERWKLAKAEFPESVEIGELETDVRSALAVRETAGAAAGEAVSSARAMEDDDRVREALVAWRGVLVVHPGQEEALQGERRTASRVERADALAAEAAERMQQGDPDGARDRLKEALALLPKDPVILGRHREAERAADELAAELSGAESALAGGAADAAVERLRILATRHPASERVRAALSRAEHAGRTASEGATRDRVQRLVRSATRLESEHRLRDASAAYREAVGVDRDCAEAEVGLARVLRELAEVEALTGQSRSLLSSGDAEGAVAAAEQAAAKVSGDPAVEGQLARARTSLETLKQEADRVRAAIAADPDEDVLSWAQDLSARFPGSALASDLLREAEQACREAEEKASASRAKTLLARARKLEQERQFERAAKAYEEAVRAAPSNVEAQHALQALRERLETAAAKTAEAQSLLDAGDPEAARAVAEEALKLLPDQVRTAGVLASARTGVAEITRAVETFESGPAVTVELAESQVERIRRLRAKYAASKRCADLETRAAQMLEEARAAARRKRTASWIADAEAALAEGRLADVDRACASARAVVPDDAAVARLAAEAASRRARAADLVGRGASASGAARHAEALKLFEQALGQDPACAEAVAGRDAAAAAIARTEEQVRKAHGEAVQADRAGRPRDALAAWERVLSVDPAHAKATSEVARLRAWIVRADEALARVAARIEAGEPEAALAAAQEARTQLGSWDLGEDALRRARALVDEVDTGVRKVERGLGAAEGELDSVAAAAKDLAARFPGSLRARDAAARAASAADERRRSIAVSQVRRLVREHRYGAAAELAAELRAQGLVSPDLEGAEAQARRVLGDVAKLRARSAEFRAAGDLAGARAEAARVQELLPEDTAARDAVTELDETIREFQVRLDAAETARRRGDVTRAVESWREALGLNPGAPDLPARIAEAQDQARRRGELVRACEAAVRAGDGAACVRAAKDVLTVFPDDEDARDLVTTGEALDQLVASLLAHARRQRDLGETDSARITAECLLRVAPAHAEARALAAR